MEGRLATKLKMIVAEPTTAENTAKACSAYTRWVTVTMFSEGWPAPIGAG